MDGAVATNILFAVGSAVVAFLQAMILGALKGLKVKIDTICKQQKEDRIHTQRCIYYHKHVDGDVVLGPEAAPVDS
jgi:cytochrome bd-type quinol oxidase subunit 2